MIVLDTDVMSFLFKGDTRAQAYLVHLQDRRWLISFMTEAELEQWALLGNWGAKKVEWLRLFFGRCANFAGVTRSSFCPMISNTY